MADYFDPSPRASKRRRTATYKATRSVLEETHNETALDTPTERSRKDHAEVQDTFEDSAYGSKEDSFVENEDVSADNLQIHNTEHARGEESTHDMIELNDPDNKVNISVQPRSSGRERRRPRRYSLSPEEPKSDRRVYLSKTIATQSREKPPQSAPPKGILTPSRKGKRTTSHKAVVFDKTEKEIEEQLGFKDIDPTSHKKRKPLKSKAQTVQECPTDDIPKRPSQKSQRKQPLSALDSQALPEPLSDFDFDEVLGADITALVPDSGTSQKELFEVPGLHVSCDHAILAIKCKVLGRLTSRGTSSLSPHLQTQYDALHSLIHSTIVSGESNSLLLLGARGSGKSQLFDTAIADLSAEHANDFHTVRLNGFIQTDDNLALREIWRQLGREMDVEQTELAEGANSYADTMSSLLSLLSHPDDFREPTANGSDVMDHDAGPIRTSKSIVFMLDEFDLFTTHPRQTLLYNLFDIAQSRKAPIAVIGSSTRMDVVDCLEKRVKSRFSHRWIHIPTAKTLQDFEAIVSTTIRIDDTGPTEAYIQTAEELEARNNWNAFVQSTFLPSSTIKALITQTFYTTKSIPQLFSALYTHIALLTIPTPSTAGGLPDTPKVQCNTNAPTSLTSLPNLPTLHIALLIAAARLDTIHNLTAVNFNLIYAQYTELISRSRLHITASGAVAVGASLRHWKRETAVSIWEDLSTYGFIVPVSGAAAGAQRDSGGDSAGGEAASVKMWRVDVTLEDLAWTIKQKWPETGGTRDVMSKWCQEI